jgi:hypothetical protein
MKKLVAFLLRKHLGWLWLYPIVVWAASLALAFTTLGYFATSGIDEKQNAAFVEAIEAEPPPRPIAAAAKAAGAGFAREQREALKRASNGVRQTRGLALDFAGSRPAKTPKQEAWNDSYVCGLPHDWGEHRPVLRTLVLQGYGECGDDAIFAASAPFLYWSNGWLGSAATWFPPLLAFLLSIGLGLLVLVRGADRWLHSSDVV